MTRRGILLFVGLGIVWGIPYALIKVAVTELEPTMLALARTALAAVVLLPIAAARHELRPLLKHWRAVLAYTIAEIVLPWFFLNAAEQHLPSSTAGLLLASIPLAAVVIGFVLGRHDRLTVANWIGLVVGMAGVAAIVGLDVAGTDLLAVAQLAVVVVGYALGPAILAKWMPNAPGVGVAAVSLAIAAVIYAPIVGIAGHWPTAWPSAPVVGSVVVLALVCSALAFVMMVALIAEIGPMRATAITYLNPAVAVIAGVLLLGERVTVWTIVGFALVVAGSYLVTRRRAGTDESGPAPGAESGTAVRPEVHAGE